LRAPAPKSSLFPTGDTILPACSLRAFTASDYQDVVPDRPKKSRGNQIRAWLRKNPKVYRYAVINDDDDQLDDLPLFQPSDSTGLPHAWRMASSGT